MEADTPDLAEWEELIKRADASRERKVKIALVGKYVQLEDAYKSVIEALTHGGWQHGVEVETDQTGRAKALLTPPRQGYGAVEITATGMSLICVCAS